jgi:hypothetical protein
MLRITSLGPASVILLAFTGALASSARAQSFAKESRRASFFAAGLGVTTTGDRRERASQPKVGASEFVVALASRYSFVRADANRRGELSFDRKVHRLPRLHIDIAPVPDLRTVAVPVPQRMTFRVLRFTF